MIVGAVTASGEAVIPLMLYDPVGRELQFNAVIDTGFSGAVALSSELVIDLDLSLRGYEPAMLADGSERLFDLYDVVIEWDGTSRHVTVLAADGGPLVGMTLLAGYELRILATPGGLVTIAALS